MSHLKGRLRRRPGMHPVRPSLRLLAPCLALLFGTVARSETLSVPPDSPRWDLEGQASAAEHQGRKCLFLDGGAAVLKDLEMRDGVVDVDVSTPATRGFFGIQFQIVDDGATAEGSTSASTRAGIRTPCSTRRSRAW